MPTERNRIVLTIMKFLRVPAINGLRKLIPLQLRKTLGRRILVVPEPRITLEDVRQVVGRIRHMDLKSLENRAFLEKELIPFVGLNNESIHQQPSELHSILGQRFHLWQYPNQLASLVKFLASSNIQIDNYVEIGSRWGGNFVFMSEVLYKLNPSLKNSYAIDIIKEPSAIRSYKDYIRGNKGPEVSYFHGSSQDFSFDSLSGRTFAFIDGDHSVEGLLKDHANTLLNSEIIVIHDISSDAVPHIRTIWTYIKSVFESQWNFIEFSEQYESVQGNFLGIGLMMRK